MVGTATLVALIGVFVGLGVAVGVSVGVGVMVGVQVGTRVFNGVENLTIEEAGVNVGWGVRVAGAWASTMGNRPEDWMANNQTNPPSTTKLTRVRRDISTVHCWSVIVATSFLSLFIIRLVPYFSLPLDMHLTYLPFKDYY